HRRPIMPSRREVLKAGLWSLAAPLTAAESRVTPDVVQMRPEIEPLVRLMEQTPREKCAEMLAAQLRGGASYRDLLAALFLAGVRNINPQPPGFAMHCVFVIHSAHQMSLDAPAGERLLPLFYALDNFKAAQDRDAKAQGGDYTMGAIKGTLPAPERAASEFTAAMEAWDQERAERAVVALARHRSGPDVIEMLWRYGARDYRNIGHKAIYVANAARTLHTIGWQHAEPVLRSLVLGLLDFGRQQQVNGYALDDQCYAGNLKRLKETKLPEKWVEDRGDQAAASEILAVMREASPDEACADVASRLAKGKASAGSVWDAVHLASAELRMRARQSAALVSIHSVTSANAMHHAYLAASDPQVRFLLALQGVGWMVQFRKFAGAREDALRKFEIPSMEPSAENAAPEKALEEIFAAIPANVDAAAARVFRLAPDVPARNAFFAGAMRYTVSRAAEVHYYKYLAALIEDVPLVSPEWQPHMLATAVYYIKGANDAETAPMKRAREVLKGLG
ncbi:MAG: hypothetical protein ACRD8O_20525, partial [Bryobacteraceae bacterium]